MRIWGCINGTLDEAYIKVNNRKIAAPVVGTLGEGVSTNTILPLSKGDIVIVKAQCNSYGSYSGVYRAWLYFFPCK